MTETETHKNNGAGHTHGTSRGYGAGRGAESGEGHAANHKSTKHAIPKHEVGSHKTAANAKTRHKTKTHHVAADAHGSKTHRKAHKTESKPGKLYLYSAIFAGVIAVVVFLLAHHKDSAKSQQANELKELETKGPLVSVVSVKEAPTFKQLLLIGETRPYAETTVYAKLSGYLKNVFVDKGDLVKADQPLAVIESPETNMGYLAAKADAYNKKRIAARMKFLVKRKLISAQEAEQAIAASDIAEAQLQTQSVLKGYEILKAPFAGVVVARYVDPGTLIQNASNSQAASLAVVTVSQIDTLRIYVYVDQRDAAQMRLGLPVELGLTERPELKLTGRIARIPQELDPRTRTLLTEIDFDNSKHELVADSYVQVKIRVDIPPSLEVPSAALVYSGPKAYLPVVDNGHLIFKEAKVIEDDGVTARFASDVKPGTPIAMNIGQTLVNGYPVRAQKPQAAQANAGHASDSQGSSASGQSGANQTNDKNRGGDQTQNQNQGGVDNNNGEGRSNLNSGEAQKRDDIMNYKGIDDRKLATPPHLGGDSELSARDRQSGNDNTSKSEK